MSRLSRTTLENSSDIKILQKPTLNNYSLKYDRYTISKIR